MIKPVFSILSFFWRLFPAIRKMDDAGWIVPGGYSRMLGAMIAWFVGVSWLRWRCTWRCVPLRNVPRLKFVLYTVLFHLENTVYNTGFYCSSLMFAPRAVARGSLKV